MGFFEVPASALRRARLADELPVETPAVFEQLSGQVLALPDPAGLTAEQRLGALQAAARLQTMLEAYQTQVAGVCDAQQDSRVFAAGTTGSMVAALTGQNRAVGSAIVGRARDLRGMPHVADAYRAGEITGRHVHLLCRAAGQSAAVRGVGGGPGRGGGGDRTGRTGPGPRGVGCAGPPGGPG
ncbi:MAG: hypothetical protein V9E82_15320 [Candidatus Nanopelagicales bacterium]